MGEIYEENNLWVLLYISVPVSILYFIQGEIVLQNRAVQIYVEKTIYFLLNGDMEKVAQTKWSRELVGRFVSITSALILVPLSAYIILTNEDFYKRHDLFSHEIRGDICLAIGFGFWIYHSLFIIFPLYKKTPLHVPHHVLVLLCIYLIIRDRTYQMGMLIAFTTELPVPFVQSVFVLRELHMKDSKAFLINGILLFIFWTIGRVFATIYLLYCYYLNWEGILTKLSPTLKIVNFVGTSFAIFVNFWWYFKICRGLVKILFGKKKYQ